MRRWRIHQNRLPVIIDHAEIAAERGIARQWQYARVAPTSRVEERRGCFGRGHLSLGHFRGHLFFHAAGTVAVKSLAPSGDAIGRAHVCNPATNAPPVRRLMPDTQNTTNTTH